MSKKKPAPKFQGSIKTPPGSKPETPVLAKQTGVAYPYFSHRYITGGAYCLKKCSIKQFQSFADKMRMLSGLDWKQIDSSPKETNGYEMIPKAQLKETPPAPFASESALMIFRFGGAKGGRIAGVRREGRFYILFIDHDFTLYKH